MPKIYHFVAPSPDMIVPVVEINAERCLIKFINDHCE